MAKTLSETKAREEAQGRFEAALVAIAYLTPRARVEYS
jgi:hypothetical protein